MWFEQNRIFMDKDTNFNLYYSRRIKILAFHKDHVGSDVN